MANGTKKSGEAFSSFPSINPATGVFAIVALVLLALGLTEGNITIPLDEDSVTGTVLALVVVGLMHHILDQFNSINRQLASMRGLIADQGTSLHKEIADHGTSLRKEIAEQGKDLRKEITDQGNEIRRELDTKITEGNNQINARIDIILAHFNIGGAEPLDEVDESATKPRARRKSSASAKAARRVGGASSVAGGKDGYRRVN